MDSYNLDNIPDTGVTRYYDFTISRGTATPDGVQRDVIVVNNQFPGPLIEANWGDWVQVTVTNEIENEGTSLHWHGLIQSLTQYSDGVPSLSMCPIAPGKTFTYRWRAAQYGSSWYHSHYSAQYNAGIIGPMIIYGPSTAEYDIDLGPVMLTDWYHYPYYSLVEEYTGTDLGILPFSSDNNLINGRNNYNCSDLPANFTMGCMPNGPLSQFRFQSGKVHRLRVMNTGSEGVQKFSIDGHSFTVIAQDFVPVDPFQTDGLTLGVGQRTDILVNATMAPDSSVWMRASIVPDIACGGSNRGDSTAMVFYEDADISKAPTSTQTASYEAYSCYNDPLTSNFVPAYSIAPGTPSLTQEYTVGLVVNDTGHFNWQMNNQTFRADYNSPISSMAVAGNTDWPAEWQVYTFSSSLQSVRFVINNPINATHPFHVHGHDAWVLAEGEGSWDGNVINPQNPVRRDTHLLRANGYLVLQINNDNPGVWPLHCHVAWHLSGGLYVNLLMSPDKIDAMPAANQQTCTDWNDWSSRNYVDEIDDGL